MPNKTPYYLTYAKDKARKARTWKQIQRGRRQAEYWRTRWQLHPETMGANLRRINGARQADAARRTTRLLEVTRLMQPTHMSWELRPSIAHALEQLGHAFDPTAVNRFLSAARRRSLVSFHQPSLSWRITRPQDTHEADKE